MSVNAWTLIRGYCFKCQSSLGQQLMRCKCGASCLNTAPDKVMQAMLLRPNFHVTNKHDMCANILIGNHLIYKQGWSNYIGATTLLRSSNCRLFERMLWQTHTLTHTMHPMQVKFFVSFTSFLWLGGSVCTTKPWQHSTIYVKCYKLIFHFLSWKLWLRWCSDMCSQLNKNASNRNHVNASWWFLEVIPADFHLQFEA